MSEISDNVLKISGRLTIDTASVLFKKGLQLKEGQSNLIIDLAAVEVVYSTAVSLMLTWLRTARIKKVQLSFVNVPDNLRSLANLYGVAEALSVVSTF